MGSLLVITCRTFTLSQIASIKSAPIQAYRPIDCTNTLAIFAISDVDGMVVVQPVFNNRTIHIIHGMAIT